MTNLNDFNPDDSINLDASASQELKRVIVAKQAEDDPTKSHVIPDALTHSIRSATRNREILKQKFDENV
ncbi:MAG: hypothetical protein KDA93_24480 [Planctomycetaceae bacterium]|nr:hypothetical protein [Planctomycetaceae bacterium]